MTVAMRDTVDRGAVLRAVGIEPNDPNAQALLLVCEKYGLDPLLKHMVLIQKRPYITRDGYLHIAHESGDLDGITIEDEGESDTHWWAKVSVHRKSMSRPFTYTGRYPKSGGNKGYGPEMAVKCAEVASLRRAFNVTGAGAADERWDDHAVEVPPAPVPEGFADMDDALAAHRSVREQLEALDDDQLGSLRDWREANGLTAWPMPALALEALEAEVAKLAEVGAGAGEAVPAPAEAEQERAGADDDGGASARSKPPESAPAPLAGEGASTLGEDPDAPLPDPPSKLSVQKLKERVVALQAAGVGIDTPRKQLGLPVLTKCTQYQLDVFAEMLKALEAEQAERVASLREHDDRVAP